MPRMWKKLTLAVAGGLMALGAGAARADIIVTLPSTTTTPFGVGFQTFTYTADLTNVERLQSGNFFTIYDIPGLFTAGTSSPNWTASVAAVGKTPPNVTPTDSPTMQNVTFTYTGPTTGAGPQNLGNFQIVTNAAFAGTAPGQFTAEAINAVGATAGTAVDNIGSVLVPAATPINNPGVPLPAAVYAFPIALAAAAQGYRKLRRQA